MKKTDMVEEKLMQTLLDICEGGIFQEATTVAVLPYSKPKVDLSSSNYACRATVLATDIQCLEIDCVQSRTSQLNGHLTVLASKQ